MCLLPGESIKYSEAIIRKGTVVASPYAFKIKYASTIAELPNLLSLVEAIDKAVTRPIQNTCKL